MADTFEFTLNNPLTEEQGECKHYKELCYSLFTTTTKLCEIMAMVKADFDDEKGEWE